MEDVSKTPGQLLITNDKDYLELYLDYQDDDEVTRKKLDVDKGVDITWAAYQALSPEEKNNGTIYYITDVDPTVTMTWQPF